MRIAPTMAAMALVIALTPGIAGAKPSASIGCALLALSPQDRERLGGSLVNGEAAAQATTAAHDFIARPAGGCAKANKWTADQTDIAISWTLWALMAAELQRESVMSAADAAVLRAYVDEDPKRLDGLDGYTAAQTALLVETLRKRGAHLHDGGKDGEREMGMVLLLKQMKAEEASFDGS